MNRREFIKFTGASMVITPGMSNVRHVSEENQWNEAISSMPKLYWGWIEKISSPLIGRRIPFYDKYFLAVLVASCMHEYKFFPVMIVQRLGRWEVYLQPAPDCEGVPEWAIDKAMGDTEILLRDWHIEIIPVIERIKLPKYKWRSLRPELCCAPKVFMHTKNGEYKGWYFGGQRAGKSMKYSLGAR